SRWAASSAPSQRDDVDARCIGLVGKGGIGRRSKAETIARAEHMPLTCFGDDEAAAQNPEELADVGVGGCRQRYVLARRHLDTDDFDGMIGTAEDLLADISSLGVAPDRLLGCPRKPLALALRAQHQA